MNRISDSVSVGDTLIQPTTHNEVKSYFNSEEHASGDYDTIIKIAYKTKLKDLIVNKIKNIHDSDKYLKKYNSSLNIFISDVNCIATQYYYESVDTLNIQTVVSYKYNVWPETSKENVYNVAENDLRLWNIKSIRSIISKDNKLAMPFSTLSISDTEKSFNTVESIVENIQVPITINLRNLYGINGNEYQIKGYEELLKNLNEISDIIFEKIITSAERTIDSIIHNSALGKEKLKYDNLWLINFDQECNIQEWSLKMKLEELDV
jgi:hypothetical protein